MTDIGRREFLKIGSIALGATAVAATGFDIFKLESNKPEPKPTITPTSVPPTPEADAGIEYTEEEKKLLGEIVAFRNSLALTGITPEMDALIKKGGKWEGAGNFDIEVEEKDRSYGMYLSLFIQKAFGGAAEHLVKGVKNNPAAPGAIQFNPADRTCILPEDVRNFSPIDGDYVDVMMHEAGGHGSDPDIASSNYPREKLFKVNHGKWRALTQMFSVPGEFLYNPGDLMYPMLKRNLGKAIGQEFTGKLSLAAILDKRGQALMSEVFWEISQTYNIPEDSIKFNKRVCRTIGEAIVPRLLQHQIEIKGTLRTQYEQSMNLVCHEIYAEMVRYAILHPEQINNAEIFEGIREVYSTINGRAIALDDIKREVAKPTQEIMDRYNAENAVMNAGPKEAVKTLSPEDLKAMAEQELEAAAREQAFNDFMQSGKIPSYLKVPPEYQDDVTKFAELIVEMNKRFPRLFGVNILWDDGYDPNLNLWEIEELDYAYDAPFIRGTLMLDEVSPQVHKEITKKNILLQKFLNMDVNLNP